MGFYALFCSCPLGVMLVNLILEGFMLSLLALKLNPISATDLWFFILCGVIVAVIIAVYFLIPVFNKKQYQEMRDNLNKREVAFKANFKGKETEVSTDTSEENTAQSDE